MRLFFAVLLPGETISQLDEIQRGLRAQIPDSGVKWARAEQFHFTLKFLGETQVEKVEKLLRAGGAVKERLTPFDVTLAGLGGFPTANRPSTLWIGAGQGAESLAEISLQLDALLVKYGYAREKRAYTPHITLARIKSYAGESQAARALKSVEPPTIASTTIDRFVLMRSTLKPTGSEYSLIEEFRLGGS